MAGWAIDLVTVLFLTLAIVLVGTAPLIDDAASRWAPEPWGSAFVSTLLFSVTFFVYETAFLAVRGQTPGMDLVQLKVIVPATGEHPSWRRAALRTLPLTLLRVVPTAIFGTVAMLLVGISAPVDRRRRGLHDFLAGTIVISYDADADDEDEDGGVPQRVDRDDLADTYGSRSLTDFIRRRKG